MAVIETSYIDNPRTDARCILGTGYGVNIYDAKGRMVILDARAVLNLLDFLGDWRKELKQVGAQVREAFELAEKHGFTIRRIDGEYYELLHPNGAVFTTHLREGNLRDAVDSLIAHRANTESVPAQ